jgi:hypothetical protein
MRIISALSLLIGAAISSAIAAPAAADFKVQMPDAETGEVSIEPLGDIGHDPQRDHSDELSSTQELEYGVNGFWRTELELEQEREAGPGESIHFSQVTWENVLQFTERGERWMDNGFFFEFGKSTLADTANEVTFGPIFRKEFFHTINTVNLFIQKDVGGESPREDQVFSTRGRHALRSAPDRAGFSGLRPAEQL